MMTARDGEHRMGQRWPERDDPAWTKGGNGKRPDKGWKATPRGDGYHPGRSCQREAVTIAVCAGLVLRAAMLAARALLRG